MVARLTADNVKAAAKRLLDQRERFQAVSVPEVANLSANPGATPKSP
jgi:hypothetical protein